MEVPLEYHFSLARDIFPTPNIHQLKRAKEISVPSPVTPSQ